MALHPMKLVTIVCEAFAGEAVIRLLGEVGAAGYTTFPVEGAGARGRRVADIPEYANVQFEVVTRPEVSALLLQRLADELFPRYAMVAFESDVRVLRDKF